MTNDLHTIGCAILESYAAAPPPRPAWRTNAEERCFQRGTDPEAAKLAFFNAQAGRPHNGTLAAA